VRDFGSVVNYDTSIRAVVGTIMNHKFNLEVGKEVKFFPVTGREGL
jgi:hypothetical protein